MILRQGMDEKSLDRGIEVKTPHKLTKRRFKSTFCSKFNLKPLVRRAAEMFSLREARLTRGFTLTYKSQYLTAQNPS